MNGELVQLVLFPRHTTLAGNVSPFTTVAMDVTPYSLGYVTVWRGKKVGSVPATPPRLWFEESTDQQAWSLVYGSPSGGDPGENTQHLYTLTFSKRWFRLRVELAESDDILSLWASGNLVRRLP